MPPSKIKPFTRECIIQCPYRKNPKVEGLILKLGIKSSVQNVFSSLPVTGDTFYISVLQEFKSKAFDIARVLCQTIGNEKVPWYGNLTNDIRLWHENNCKVSIYNKRVPQGLCVDIFITSCKYIRPAESSLLEHWNLLKEYKIPPVWVNTIKWDYPESELIVLLCRNLQMTAGNKVFVLKHKALASIMRCTQRFVSTQLEILELDGFIFRTFRGTKGRASEYRYIAKEIPDKFKSHRDIVSKLQKG